MTWQTLKQKQAKVVRLLENSIKTNRLAHAYIFEGGKGTGKKEIALQLGKSFFCKERQGADPCQMCVDCRRIDSSNHPDVHIISPEGQSIKKEKVQHLQKEFTRRGMESTQKFYIIEQADKLTVGAANSLLKFLEEPEAPTVAILITEQIHKLLPTIRSRSQILTFSPLPPDQLIQALEDEGIPKAIATLAASMTTNYEEAFELCQDNWIVQGRTLMLQLTEETDTRRHQVFLTLHEKWLPHFNTREQLEIGLDMLLLWYRDVLFAQLQQSANFVYIDQVDKLAEHALRSSQQRISRQMTAVFDAKRYLSANVNPQLLMEKLLLKLQEG